MALFVNRFRIICKKGSGTFADVWKCEDLLTGELVACKRMKQTFNSVEEAESLRELATLRRLKDHENLLTVVDMLYERKYGKITLVFDLMDMNLYEFIRNRKSYIPEVRVQSYMYQLCKAVEHLHRQNIFHRDIKPENILIKGELLKLGDFGSCRATTSKPPYTEYISTRWYRSPECLLTTGYYTNKMDMWSVGCVFFEIISLHPLFPGNNEVDQVARIHRVLGSVERKTLEKFSKHKSSLLTYDFPKDKGTGIEMLLPHTCQRCRELIKLMCTYDPDDRISAYQALMHPYFKKFRRVERKPSEKTSSVTSESRRNRSRRSEDTISERMPMKCKSSSPVDLDVKSMNEYPRCNLPNHHYNDRTSAPCAGAPTKTIHLPRITSRIPIRIQVKN